MYDKLQYISQGNTAEEQLYNIRGALDHGCQWIQLRFKTQNSLQLFDLAESTKILCDLYSANYIINDNTQLAQQLDADGVHLGLSDMNITEARTVLGDQKIIGGTANTFEDIQFQIKQGANYIGLGPFRFTTTKDHLSPILGLEGYHSIIQKMKQNNIEIPIYAIGGIALDNVESLIRTGIYGIAVSGLITENDSKTELINALNEKLYENVII